MQNLDSYFPIHSQTSESDKIFLLSALELVKQNTDSFRYLEIGSFLGGSLTPFLLEKKCQQVVSIDRREQQQPDERGLIFDYGGITNQTMIDKIRSHNIDTSKLMAFDCSVDTYDKSITDFDLAFIDGEHTDVACFRDFIWTLPMMKKDSIVLFHDSTITYKGLQVVNEYLKFCRIEYYIAKTADSEIIAIFFGKFVNTDFEKVFGKRQDIKEFLVNAEKAVLAAAIQHRLEVQTTYTVKDIKVLKVQ